MRIAFVLGRFPVLSQTFILNQITGLLDLGHEVDIFAVSRSTQDKVHPDVEAYRLMDHTRYLEAPSCRTERVLKAFELFFSSSYKDLAKPLGALNVFRFGKDALSLRYFYYLFPFLLEKRDYDILHCHFGPLGELGVVLKEFGIEGKLVTTFYGYDVSRYVGGSSTDTYNALFQKGDLFIAISDYMRNQLIGLGCNEEKVIRHPLGIKTGGFQLRERKGVKSENVKILTVARLVEKKGLEYSIKAVAKIIKKHPSVEYRIAGDGPLKGDLRALIENLGVRDEVSLLGWQNREKIEQLYQQSHIFVLPSVIASDGDQEGTPTVLLEAQAWGLPVVSTLHAGIPEIVVNGKSGFLVPERNEDALAEKLEYLVQRPTIWMEMGQAGRRFVEECHDISKLNRRLVKVYKAVLTGDMNGLHSGAWND